MNVPSLDLKRPGVNTPSDHPDDQQVRETLRSVLYVARKDLTLQFKDLSYRAGRGAKWGGDMEVRSNSLHWKFDDVWLWGQVVGRDVRLTIGGIAALSLLKIGPLARISIMDSRYSGIGLMEYLRSLRVEMGVEQKELARRLDVTHGSVWDMEESGSPKISTIQRYARALGGHLEFQVDKCEPKVFVSSPF